MGRYPPERLKSFSRAGLIWLIIKFYMFTVYVLLDDSGKIYKGMTNNIDRRLKEHKNGGTITTSRMKNLKIAYSDKYDSFVEARKRELYFKTAAGRRFLKTKINMGR